jgi:RNA polymerase sigma-70 factor (family 1)
VGTRNYQNYTDQILVDLLCKDDTGAYAEIYRRYWKRLLLMAWNHSDTKAAAEDIVHEVFISLWERKHEVDIKDVRGFLITSVKYSVFKAFQKKTRREGLIKNNYDFIDVADDEKKLDARFLQDYIDGIVDKMPEKYSIVFRYSRELGLKNTEIAKMVNISEKGVEARLTRALKLIRGGLKNYGFLIFYLSQVINFLSNQRFTKKF